jgi:polyprenyldihydroxybenzoate methyltransferase / 3-demethylubiquinol 3-O-methyltransferase
MSRSHTATSSPGGPPQSTPAAAGTTVNPKETKKFAALSHQWWDPNGPFRPLHQLNPTRCRFIRTALIDKFDLDPHSPQPLNGLRILDVGCGGGILSESLARMGAHVQGIDATAEGPEVAAAHAATDPQLESRLQYRTTTVEDVVSMGETYDAVIASEVIEHVASVPDFCNALVGASVPGGSVILSTINRTARAYALAIVAAERVLRLVPPGTHEWSKFVTPAELTLAMRDAGSGPAERAAGMQFDIVRGKWDLSRDIGINYIMSFGVPKDES